MQTIRRAALAALTLALPAAALAQPVSKDPRPAAQQTAAGSHTIGLARDAQLAMVLGEVRPARIRHVDSMLVSFGTRNTFSDTLSSTRGIGAARRWLHAQMSEISRGCNGCLRVEYDAAMVEVARHPQRPTVNVVNVLGWLPGRDTSRVVVIGGHYDSCICSVPRAHNGLSGSFDPVADAPGADDDGSGTAAVVELARAFTARYPKGLETTVIFALYAAEEQGLLGSTHLAERLEREGYRVVAGMTDDIVGNVVADDGTRDDRTVRVFADEQENGPSQELARLAWAVSELYRPGLEVLPVFRLDRLGRGGDHAPFVRKGLPGLRFTERLENYKRQHLPTDDLEHVDFDYVAKVARLNAAVVGALALAPATPDSVRARRDRDSGGQKWRLTWAPVPNAASYEVVVRRTSAPTWEKVVRVASGTEHLLEDQLDDVWVGVRAVGANGHRSLAAIWPAPTPPRPQGGGAR